ncbi:MAG: hypothetical protein HETSPECPRED_008851 [Heterodermia speciosa]|uniref:Uncharacterized protein n=1 Tax=Heterodermia speciosa TaxID=116794 RepID=A0A8H3HZN0_9LECA|nr:MAG: hypothetical protein HETSPECPRED_008851 [Heterodermia speciosa]
MAMHEDLVDLSLFATSPTNDFQFDSMDSPSWTHTEYYAPPSPEPPSQRQEFQSQRHTGSHLPVDFDIPAPPTATFDFGFSSEQNTTHVRSFYDPPDDPVIRPLPRSYTLKPLPPLPPKKLCKPRPSRARSEAQSRCILNRLKKTRSEDPNSHRDPLQQRRNFTSAPQLTLTLPLSARGSTNTAPEMIWLPDEQMWLVTDHRAQEHQPSPPQYSATRDVTQRQPSPSIYSDRTPPLTPDLSSPRNPLIDEDGLSPIQLQFRSLVVDQERRSPLFQEATQTIEDFNPMRSSQQYQATLADDRGWPVDDDGWTVYDPRMYESDNPLIHPSPSPSDELEEEPISPESPHTPDSPFDEIEREWNSAVSVCSASNSSFATGGDPGRQQQQQHSRDTSDQSYHSAVSSMAWGKDEDPVDFYLTGMGIGGMGMAGAKPLWHGIARSISTQAGRRSF